MWIDILDCATLNFFSSTFYAEGQIRKIPKFQAEEEMA